jgi:hypothetical protein
MGKRNMEGEHALMYLKVGCVTSFLPKGLLLSYL